MMYILFIYFLFSCGYLLQEEKPKEKEKGKSRNIDHFMEELKREQEMRERRNQDREHSRDGRHTESSTVSDLLITFLDALRIVHLVMQL